MKVQKERILKFLRQSAFAAVLFCMVIMLIGQTSLTVNAQGKAKVVADSGKVRAAAGTDSEVKASVVKDDELDIIAQTKDSAGYTWYKVYVNGTDTGYIRADLLSEATGTIPTEDSNTQSDSATTDNSAQQTEFVQVTDSTAAAGKVTADSVNVRENPSTKAAIAGKATGGTEVAISGETTDSAGKVWYQVSFGDTTGFIRSDFLEITQTVEPEVEEPVEEVEEPVEEVEEPVNQDYELVYEANAEGVEEWFLYDYNRGTKQSLENLLTVVRQAQEEEKGAVSQLKTFKMITIVLAAVILGLVIVVTILIFKLRDSYEYEYEDDEEDVEEDDEDDEGDDEEDDDEDDEEEDVRRPVFRKATSAKKSSSRVVEERQPVKAAPKAEQEKKDTSWQSKNFLDVDDDMEFEFLDLK